MSSELRIVVMGAAGVGKTAVTIQFASGVFVTNYDPTIEDSYRKYIPVEGKEVMSEIVDTAGTSQFQALRDLYLKLGNVFLFIYDVTDKATFQDLDEIFETLQRTREDEPPIVLLANKVDLPSHRHKVTRNEGYELAKRFNDATFMEVSALSNFNIEKAFAEAAMRGFYHRQSKMNSDQEQSKPNKRLACTIL